MNSKVVTILIFVASIAVSTTFIVPKFVVSSPTSFLSWVDVVSRLLFSLVFFVSSITFFVMFLIFCCLPSQPVVVPAPAPVATPASYKINLCVSLFFFFASLGLRAAQGIFSFYAADGDDPGCSLNDAIISNVALACSVLSMLFLAESVVLRSSSRNGAVGSVPILRISLCIFGVIVSCGLNAVGNLNGKDLDVFWDSLFEDFSLIVLALVSTYEITTFYHSAPAARLRDFIHRVGVAAVYLAFLGIVLRIIIDAVEFASETRSSSHPVCDTSKTVTPIKLAMGQFVDLLLLTAPVVSFASFAAHDKSMFSGNLSSTVVQVVEAISNFFSLRVLYGTCLILLEAFLLAYTTNIVEQKLSAGAKFLKDGWVMFGVIMARYSAANTFVFSVVNLLTVSRPLLHFISSAMFGPIFFSSSHYGNIHKISGSLLSFFVVTHVSGHVVAVLNVNHDDLPVGHVYSSAPHLFLYTWAAWSGYVMSASLLVISISGFCFGKKWSNNAFHAVHFTATTIFSILFCLHGAQELLGVPPVFGILYGATIVLSLICIGLFVAVVRTESIKPNDCELLGNTAQGSNSPVDGIFVLRFEVDRHDSDSIWATSSGGFALLAIPSDSSHAHSFSIVVVPSEPRRVELHIFMHGKAGRQQPERPNSWTQQLYRHLQQPDAHIRVSGPMNSPISAVSSHTIGIGIFQAVILVGVGIGATPVLNTFYRTLFGLYGGPQISLLLFGITNKYYKDYVFEGISTAISDRILLNPPLAHLPIVSALSSFSVNSDPMTVGPVHRQYQNQANQQRPYVSEMELPKQSLPDGAGEKRASDSFEYFLQYSINGVNLVEAALGVQVPVAPRSSKVLILYCGKRSSMPGWIDGMMQSDRFSTTLIEESFG